MKYKVKQPERLVDYGLNLDYCAKNDEDVFADMYSKKLTEYYEPTDYCWIQLEVQPDKEVVLGLHFESDYNDYYIRNEIIQEYNKFLNQLLADKIIEKVE